MKELELLEALTTPDEVIKNEEISLTDAVAHFESELIRTALIQTKGHQRNAARLLGTKVTTLNMKMKRYGIDCREFTFLTPNTTIKTEIVKN
jgi:Nif-specific regulatory protein